ncbi:MAG: TIGR03620 family F420-dependent LLM class oxidoreductase [Acidimicrobiales bacterium]
MTSCDRGVWLAPEGLTGEEVRALGPRLEALGYSRLWVGETFGRDPFALLAAVGASTTTLGLATGIANIYNRHPGVMLQGANTVAEQTGGRMMLGLGVSSPAIVNKVRGIEYDKPLSFLRTYLDTMDDALYTSVPPAEPVPRVLAALGPKMLELAAARTAGAHPYNTTPEHTAMARAVMGPDAGLFVEQKVMLTEDAELARTTGAKVLKFYSRAPGYRNAWLKMGFSEEDVDGLSEKLVDGLVAWGDVDRIEARLAEHADAGATHVCIHPLHPEQGQGALDDDVLAALAPGAVS